MGDVFLKYKIKHCIKDAKKAVAIYLSLPNIWLLLGIAVLAIISLVLSMVYYHRNGYLSSLFSNLFTGLVTGVIICLITTVRFIWLYKTESKINWINEVHSMCLEFINKHRELVLFGRGLNEDNAYDEIYDLLCMGNNVSCKISQDRYKKEIPFNTYTFCKKRFKFDATSIMESNEDIRDSIVYGYYNLSKNDLRLVFEEMEKTLFELNSELIKEKEHLLIKMKYMNVSML